MTTFRPTGALSGQINAIGYGAWAAGGAEDPAIGEVRAAASSRGAH